MKDMKKINPGQSLFGIKNQGSVPLYVSEPGETISIICDKKTKALGYFTYTIDNATNKSVGSDPTRLYPEGKQTGEL